MNMLHSYYNRYWSRAQDVSDQDVTTPERKDRLLKALKKYCVPGAPVLDLGCGWGMFTAVMRSAGYQAVGLDISEKAIERARLNHPEVEYNILDADGSIPFEDDSFSAVWSTEVIEHVLDVPEFLNEINRVIRPGGIFILTTPYHGLAKNLLIVFAGFDRHFKVDGSHIRFFNRRSLTQSLGRSGFQSLIVRGIGRCWPVYRSWFVIAKKGWTP